MKAGISALVLALLVVLALASDATAKNGVHVSGTYAVTDEGSTTCAPVGTSPNLLLCHVTGFVAQYAGDMTGTSTVDFTDLIDCKTGHYRGQGIETFTGTIEGVGAGTLTWHEHFHGTTNCETFELSEFFLKALGFSGTGDLAALDGKIGFTLDTYDGVLH